MKTYSEELINEALNLRKKGVSFRKVSTKLKVPLGTIRGWVARNKAKKIVSATAAPLHTEDFKNQIVQEILNSGQNIKAIADKHGLKYHNVYMWYHKYKNKKSNEIEKTSFEKPTVSNKEVEFLKARNEFLKAKNDYLQKIIDLNSVKID